jgi:hypothetical protein
MRQLSDCTVEDLYKRTRFGPTRLQSLIGRALLWKYVFGISNKKAEEGTQPQTSKSAKTSSPLRQLTNGGDGADNDNNISLPFPDIQSLCTYLLKRDLSDITEKTPPTIDQEMIQQFSCKFKVPLEVLQQIVSRAIYFKKRLEFAETEETIDQIIADELGEVRQCVA